MGGKKKKNQCKSILRTAGYMHLMMMLTVSDTQICLVRRDCDMISFTVLLSFSLMKPQSFMITHNLVIMSLDAHHSHSAHMFIN